MNTSSYSNSTYPPPPYPPVGIGFLATIAGLTSLCTILGNLLVLLAFILERSVRQPANYFIASLAVTDLLIGLFSMPLYTLYLLQRYWPLGKVLCDLWLSLDYTVCLVSQYTVFLITLDRFCSVRAPAKYRNWRTTRKIKVMIAVTWFVPAIVFFTSIFGWDKFTNSVGKTDELLCSAQFQNDPYFSAILVISYYWITLVIMIGLYIGIYRVALRLHTKAREKRNRIRAIQDINSPNNDMEPLNNRIDIKRSNGNGKTFRKREMASSDSSNHPDDSENSNDSNHSSGSTVSPTPKLQNNSLSTITASRNGSPAKLAPKGSPLWKPRQSLPNTRINWSAFSQINETSSIDHEMRIEREVHSHQDMVSPIKAFGSTAKLDKDATAQTRARSDHKMSSGKQKSKSENRARKALKTISFILGAFVLCWTPYHVCVLVAAFCEHCRGDSYFLKFYDFAYWLCYINSPINPFCYALSNQQFKQAFIKILRGEHIKKIQLNCFKR